MYSIYKNELIKRTGKKDYELKIQKDNEKKEKDMDKKFNLASIHSKWSDYSKNNIVHEYNHLGIWVISFNIRESMNFEIRMKIMNGLGHVVQIIKRIQEDANYV